LTAGSPQACADALQPYLDAGFSGFTFGNTVYRTPESMALVGETLRLIGG
jgi:alkanesulfonate monooxygenase SsuD/methylene tetrahydromethanopterin reductase-like flavin-dependent oxidoreductase (luciferase family)